MLESKRKALIFLILAFVTALLAGFLFLQQVQSIQTELGGSTEVYVAESNISSRALITEEDVATMDVPNRFITSSHITDPSELIEMVSVVPLNEGDLITQNVLRPFSNVTDEQNRLVALHREDGVVFDQQLEALDRVDLIVSHSFDGDDETEVFLTDVPVAMVMEQENTMSGVALEVSEEIAPQLIHMQNYADNIHVLRANVGDDDESLDQGRSEEEEPEADESEEDDAEEEQSEEEEEEDEADEEEDDNDDDEEEDEENDDDNDDDDD